MCACILDGASGRVLEVNKLFEEEMGAKFKFLEFAFEQAAADAESEAKLATALNQARDGRRKCRARDVKMLTLGNELPIARHFDWTVSAMSSGSIAVFGELVTEADEVQREKDAALIDFFQNAPIAMHWLSGQGIVLWANNTELRVLGYTAEEYIGQPIMNFCPDEEELVLEIFKTLGSGNAIKDVPVRFRHKDGRIVPLLIDSNVNYTKTGAFNHTRCFIRDDTGRRVNEARQKLLFEQMKRSLKLFDAFVTKTLHLIRTPLHVALGEIEVLASLPSSGDEGCDRGRVLNHVSGLLEGITDMTSDVHEVLQLEKGSILKTQAKAADLDKLGTRVVDEIAPLLDPSSSVELVFELDEGCDVLVTDEDVLHRALRNLLRNAVTATKTGHVTLRVSAGEDAVVFAVEDTGCGIDLSNQEGLFLHQRYYTPTSMVDVADAEQELVKLEQTMSLQSDKQGIGIGLSLAYALVHAIGGELEVTSTPGEGSRFFFSLPKVGQSRGGCAFKAYLPLKAARMLGRRAGGKKGRSPFSSFRTVTEPVPVVKSECVAKQGCFEATKTPCVLIVDDSGLCAKLLSRMVVKAGCVTEWASDGAEGVAKLREHVKAPVYDMVFMDLRMPVMDGFEATRIAKKELGLQIPIVALTAELGQETQEQCRDVGFDHCVSKPVNFTAVCTLLQTFAGIPFDPATS